MKTRVLAAAILCTSVLAACSPAQQQQAAECGLALYAARAATAAELFMAAQATPACMALGMDAMQMAVREAMLRRGIR